MKTVNIDEFIKEKGQAYIARELGISVSTIAKWSGLTKPPRPATAAILINYAKGELSWRSIYQPFFDNEKTGNRE